MDLHNPRPWPDAEPFRVLKAFWSCVRDGSKLNYGLQKAYITGATPLHLSDLARGANDHEDISFSPQISAICGLTRSDVLGALKLICNSEEELQKHLGVLVDHANGYHFCQQRRVEPVFNPVAVLSYLQVSK
jgi:Predicted AAA-ATPase